MAYTKIGRIATAARRAGIDPEEYKAKVEAGLKRCAKCKQWSSLANYTSDKSRYDGKQSRCQDCELVKNPRTTKGRVSPFKGHKHTPEAIAKTSASNKGNKNRLGKKHTLESRKRMSASMRANARTGPKAHAYKDGKLVERRGERFSTKYKRWRFDVFARDHFTCQDCGDSRGGNLNAHHLKPFADFPDLRFEISNGITLCTPCHKARH